MSSTRRARRMARNHKRMARPQKLNLVALMDIFTILVLFLIVNNGDVEVLQADHKVTLPDSLSEQRPEATLVIKVTATDILLAGNTVATVDEALTTEDGALPALAQALNTAAAAQAASEALLLEEEDPNGRPIIIMGDKDTPYALLKRIMATCAATDYRDISLAVNSVAGEPERMTDESLALSGVNL